VASSADPVRKATVALLEGNPRLFWGHVIKLLIERGWRPPPPDERIVDDLLAAMDTFGVKQANMLGLTPAQVRVMELVAIGKSNGEVAEALGVSEQTVKFHLTNIYKALGVTSRTEAAIAFVGESHAA
jgi:DNA-binding NarL/FixJ family response regulator